MYIHIFSILQRHHFLEMFAFISRNSGHVKALISSVILRCYLDLSSSKIMPRVTKVCKRTRNPRNSVELLHHDIGDFVKPSWYPICSPGNCRPGNQTDLDNFFDSFRGRSPFYSVLLNTPVASRPTPSQFWSIKICCPTSPDLGTIKLWKDPSGSAAVEGRLILSRNRFFGSNKSHLFPAKIYELKLAWLCVLRLNLLGWRQMSLSNNDQRAKDDGSVLKKVLLQGRHKKEQYSSPIGSINKNYAFLQILCSILCFLRWRFKQVLLVLHKGWMILAKIPNPAC